MSSSHCCSFSVPWVLQHAPQELAQMVGNGAEIEECRKWLHGLVSGIVNKHKDLSPPILFLHGPPGIGKTTLARLLCNEIGLAPFRWASGDIRSKKRVQEVMDRLMLNRPITTMRDGATAATTAPITSSSTTALLVERVRHSRLPALIIDDVDGMSCGDMGGLHEMVSIVEMALAKHSPGNGPVHMVPVVCVSDRPYEKRAPERLMCHVQLRAPSGCELTEFISALFRTHERADLATNSTLLQTIADASGADIRHAVTLAENIANAKIMQQQHRHISSSSHDGDLAVLLSCYRLLPVPFGDTGTAGLFRSTAQLLGDATLTPNRATELFSTDPVNMSLLLFENFATCLADQCTVASAAPVRGGKRTTRSKKPSDAAAAAAAKKKQMVTPEAVVVYQENNNTQSAVYQDQAVIDESLMHSQIAHKDPTWNTLLSRLRTESTSCADCAAAVATATARATCLHQLSVFGFLSQQLPELDTDMRAQIACMRLNSEICKRPEQQLIVPWSSDDMLYTNSLSKSASHSATVFLMLRASLCFGCGIDHVPARLPLWFYTSSLTSACNMAFGSRSSEKDLTSSEAERLLQLCLRWTKQRPTADDKKRVKLLSARIGNTTTSHDARKLSTVKT